MGVIATAWGYDHSALVEFVGDKYHLAFMAKKPVKILRTFKDGFSHSAAAASIDGVVYILAQLNPQSPHYRAQEADILVAVAKNYTAQGLPVRIYTSRGGGTVKLIMRRSETCTCLRQAA